jgi:hypothetical protein
MAAKILWSCLSENGRVLPLRLASNRSRTIASTAPIKAADSAIGSKLALKDPSF